MRSKSRKPAKNSQPSSDAADAEVSADEDWPAHAQLRGTNLKEQHILIRQLCRDAIKIVHTTLVTTHAWPELTRLSEYRREVLSKAAKSLQKTDAKYSDIRLRIKKDERFSMIVGKLVSLKFTGISIVNVHILQVMDRLATARGPARQRGLDHIALFQLGVGEVCIQRVQALVANDTYIYPGKWGTDEAGQVCSVHVLISTH